MSQIVVVQSVCAEWTKAARGGDLAAKRNAVAEAVKILVQRVPLDRLQWLHHRVVYSERDEFRQPNEELICNPAERPFRLGCVTIDEGDNSAVMTYRYTTWYGGAPDRSWAQKTFYLAPGEWAQMISNARFRDYDTGQWYYQKVAVNVALAEQVTPGMFTHSAPTYRFAAIGNLY